MKVISDVKKTEFITKDKSNQYNFKNNKENSTVNNSNMTENLEIAPVKSEELTESYSQKEQVSIDESLKQYGIRDCDIARLQNGEITLEALMKEIDKDPDRKREILESQALLNSITNLENAEYRINKKVYNLEELDNYIKKLESELNGYTNDLHKDEELNALAKIIKFLENGVDLDSALISGTVAYMYLDANGEKHYVYEQPIGSMMNDQINAGKHYIIGSDGRTYESLNYKEMYGESEYIKELRNNLTKGNSNFFEKTFLNQNDEVYKYDKNSDQSKYIESLKEKISNSQKESDELEAKIYELTEEIETCKYISTNVKEEVDYFMDNINPYVMQDDFLANKDFNNDSTKTINDLIAKYNFSSSLSQKNYVSAPIIKISAQKEKVDIISCIINGKENISNGFLMTGNSAYMLDSSDDIISHYASWSKLMSDKEVEIFNYIYNTDTSANKDKAYQYLKDISKELDNRWLQNRTKEDEEFAGSHHTLASLGSIVVTPVEGISALCYSLKEYANEKLHPEDPTAQIYRTDVYSSGNVWRSKVARDIAETKGDLASFIYSTGMSMADSVSLIALSAATGGTATPVLSAGLMGSRAYVSTLNDSLDRGLSDGQAVLLAASSAVVETAMESYSVGHLMNLEEHLGTGVVKIVDDIAKDISNPQVANIVTKGFYVIANSVCQGVAEGEEELATEVLNYVSDIFVSKDSSQFCESIQYYLDNGYTEDQALYATLNNFKGQLIQAFAGGFASGLCFGSFGGINSTINTSYGISQDLYTDLQGDTKAQQFANALEINQQQLSELEAAAKKNGQNLTQSEIELLQNGTIEQQAANALKNKIFSKNSTDVNIGEINKIREYNQENGFQVTEADFGPLYSFYAKSGFFSKEQTKNMIENINSQGYISEDVGSYLDTLFDGESDIYIKTVHSNDVDSIFREGIRCMGNTTSGFGEVPTSIENVELENTVTKLDGLFELVTRIKNAKGISQGGNPIDGTLIIKVPKGTNLKDSLVWNNQTKTFNINPDTISSFIPLNNEAAVSLKLNNDISQNNNITPLSEQEIESFIDKYLKDPTTTIPKGISNELAEYLVKYSHDPDTTIPLSVPKEIINYIQNHANITPSFFTTGGDLSDSSNTQNNDIAPLSEQEIESFIDKYLKDPTTTIPKGISNELAEYLVNYSHNPNATIPVSIPTEIINYIQSHSNINQNISATGGNISDNNGLSNVDDLVKKIDAKIAELETILKEDTIKNDNSKKDLDFSDNLIINKEYYESDKELMEDVKQLLMAHYLRSDINLSIANMGETGKMYEFTLDGKTYLVKPGVNKGNGKVRPARAEVQEAASRLQKIISPDGYVKVNTYGSGNVKIAVQEKIPNAKNYSGEIEGHIEELLHEYVTDYLLANFDSAACNFIIDSNGKLRGIDKEQSFKYLLSDDYKQSLDLNFNYFPEGSMINIYPSFLEYIENNGLLDEISPILEDIKLKLSNISDKEYMDIFRKYAIARDANNADMMLERILERKNYFLNHIDDLMLYIKMKNSNEVNFSELFNGKLGAYGDAVTIVSNDKVLTKYNIEADGNQTRNIANILSEITGESINENELINGTKKGTDYGAIVSYNSFLDSLIVGIELPQTITTELIEGLEKLDEQWKKVTIEEGISSKIFVNDKYISRVIDPNEDGVNIHEFDKIIKILKDRKSLIDQREELQDKFYSMVPLNRKVKEFTTLDFELQQEVSKKATELRNQAITNANSITSDIESLTDVNTRTINLDKNIKSLSSLQEKIAKRVKVEKINQEIINQEVSTKSLVENSISDITDVLRYTLVVDEKNYTDIVLDKLLELTKKGYQVDWVGNSWGDHYYQGLNMTLISPNGQYFELQFHTEDSLMVKEELNHVYYEQSRDTTLSEDARKIAQEIQRLNQELYVESTNFIYKSTTDVKKAIKAHELSKTLLEEEKELTLVPELFPKHEIISYEDYKNLTLKELEKWNEKLEKTTYVDPVTKRQYSYHDLIEGYISEGINIPGSYKLLNSINRALSDSKEQTIQNLINGKKQDSDGLYPIKNGNYTCVGLYDPKTELVYYPKSDKKIGLNVDRSVGTIDDLITRVKSESKALINTFMKSPKNIILKRRTGMGPLRAYGITAEDSASTIYKKLTTTEDGTFVPTYFDSSFMSTTPDGDFGSYKDVCFIMAVNKGTPLGNFALESNSNSESELLLPPKTKFDIIGVKKDLYGKIFIYLEQI